MIFLDKCPICGSKNIVNSNKFVVTPIPKYELMPNVTIDAGAIVQYCICRSCNIYFQNPRLSDKELEDFYQKGYYRKAINITDDKKNNDGMGRAKFDSEIIKKQLGLNIDSHLDIGCSRGYLLEYIGAKKKVGVDTDYQNVSVKNIKIFKKLSDVKDKFDLVTLIHTLEHVPYPKDYLEKVANLLKPDGYFVVEVPTWNSPGGALRLPHLYHFEPDALRLLLKEAGLKPIQTEFTPHLIFICKLIN